MIEQQGHDAGATSHPTGRESGANDRRLELEVRRALRLLVDLALQAVGNVDLAALQRREVVSAAPRRPRPLFLNEPFYVRLVERPKRPRPRARAQQGETRT